MPAWWDVTAYTLRDLVVFAALIQAGLQLLTVLVPYVCERTVAGRIAVKGKHLDVLDTTDVCFIVFNKLSTVVFIYHLLLVAARTDSIKWAAADATLANTLGSLVAFYPVYDLFYSLFHRALHHRAVYKWVHKHHHKQKAPSRGNADAVNVHPFEFLTGEYLHLLTVWLVPCHMVAVFLFVAVGGVLASLNHTRFAVAFSSLYDVKWHDVHHRLPESNYGQYIMLWDKLLGTYRSYDWLDGETARGAGRASRRAKAD